MSGLARDTSFFGRFARWTSRKTGQPIAFVSAFAIILAWALTGPIFHFSNTWQLVINTGTTVVTFLMVFLIQATQNRDSEAMHLKLDELIRATQAAHNELLDLEELSEKDLDLLREKYEALARKARERSVRAFEPAEIDELKSDVGPPDSG